MAYVTTLPISPPQIFKRKLDDLLIQKKASFKDQNLDSVNEVERITFEEQSGELWGGSKPKITLEYDMKNEYLLTATIRYNRDRANKNLTLTSVELRTKLERMFDDSKIWDVKGEDHSREDLAVDKRKAIEESRLQKELEEEEEGDEEED